MSVMLVSLPGHAGTGRQPLEHGPETPIHAPEKFVEGAKRYRELLRSEGLGRFEESYLPANPRTRQVAETAKWTAYDVVLDVYPELFAWGVLVVPKELKTANGGRWWSANMVATACLEILSMRPTVPTTTLPPSWQSAVSSLLRPTISIAGRIGTAG